ncbi:hypothetical protein GTY64_30605 [Streptomyces sp. SID8376]|nr:hypothetical protein [Streptomyces sp. SID8376]
MNRDLNERQQAVFDWVGQGCPDGVWPDSTYKVSALTMQNRGLIKVIKRRGHWGAQLTDKGQHSPTAASTPLSRTPNRQSDPAASRNRHGPRPHRRPVRPTRTNSSKNWPPTTAVSSSPQKQARTQSIGHHGSAPPASPARSLTHRSSTDTARTAATRSSSSTSPPGASPTPPKPSGDGLKPFLKHWSPYEPRSY